MTRTGLLCNEIRHAAREDHALAVRCAVFAGAEGVVEPRPGEEVQRELRWRVPENLNGTNGLSGFVQFKANRA